MKSLLLVGMLIFLVGCTFTTVGDSINNDPIKIGVIAPLTGTSANYGEDSLGAITIALEEVNAAGGINGRPIQIIAEDDKCSDAKMATEAAQKLIEIDNVTAIVGQVCSTAVLASAPIAEAAKVPFVSCCAGNPALTNAGDYIFRVWPSNEVQGRTMAEYIYNLGIRIAATLYTTSDYNYALQDVFAKEFERLGGNIVAQETYAPDSKDFRTQITKIKAKDPEAVYVVPYGEGGLVLKQMRELGIKSKIFGSETISSTQVVADAAGAAEGVIYATPSFDRKNNKTKEFLETFKTKYGKDPSIPVGSASAYDSFMVVVEAMKAQDVNQGANREAIKKYLYTIKNYTGVSGIFSIDSNGDANKQYQLMKIENNTFNLLDR